MDTTLQSLQQGVAHTISHLRSEFAKLQTGRASASLVENVPVEAYGQIQPLKSIAGISVQDAATVAIQPWDRSILGNVEKALAKADLGAMPVNDGMIVRLSFPPMTEERRKHLVKIVQELAEEARISVRQTRQEFHGNVKKDKSHSEDEHFRLEKAIQEAVEKANKEIEELAKKKEEEVMKV